ncbi:MAG: sulfotransferase domain-containing protein [Planctomycetota bacterium]
MGSSLLQNVGRRLRRSPLLLWAGHHGSVWIGTRFSESIPMYFVIGYPKSGTTWVTQLVADYLMLPYPQHLLLPATFPAVIHGHESLTSSLIGRCIYTVRDPRDAVMSYYWRSTKQLKINKTKGRLRAYQRGLRANPDNLEDHAANIPAFVERYLENTSGTRHTWRGHVQTYLRERERVPLVTYERLLESPVEEMSQAIEALTGETTDRERMGWAVAKYSFANRKKVITPGYDKSFLRSGRSGGWRDWVTRKTAEVFAERCGDELVQFGYEADASWIDACPPALPEREPEAAHA